jgi:4-hydroxybenzoate polyprenyltransferase
MTRLRDVVELIRMPAALSVPGDVIAGAASARTLSRGTAAMAVASTCLYWSGMAANDWADRDLDATERPQRPIPSGRVSGPAALRLASGLSAVGLAVAAGGGGWRALRVAAPLAALVWAYDLRLKNTCWGPAAMSGCRALDVLLGASPGALVRAVPAAAAVATHTYTVSLLSRGEVAGADCRLVAATLAGTGLVAGVAAGANSAVGRVLAGWYAFGYGGAQLRAAIRPTVSRVRAAVATGIVDLPTLQGSLIVRAGAGRAGLTAGILLAAAAPLGRLLARRVSPT